MRIEVEDRLYGEGGRATFGIGPSYFSNAGGGMSLVSFHRALILVAIAFCLGFSGWQLRAATVAPDGTAGALVLAVVFALLAAGLTVYLVRLRSILRLED